MPSIKRSNRQPANAAAPKEERKRERGRGQSLVEFAIILPILLGLVGGALDFARVFYQDIKLQDAVSNAAMSTASDTTIPNGDTNAALQKAYPAVCKTLGGTPSAMPGTCAGTTNPLTVIVSQFTKSSAAPGTTVNPLATITLTVTQPFDMLFPYPWMSPPGHFTLSHTYSVSVLQPKAP